MKNNYFKDVAITGFHGFTMSLADSVPGVSGGTIAFILGFYDKFICSCSDIISKDKEKRKDAFSYLIKLGIGWAFGMILCILILSKIFDTYVYGFCSAFIGLTIAAIPFIIIEEKAVIKGKYYNIIFAVLGAALVVGITLLRGLDLGIGSINFIEGLTPIQYIYVFFVGAFAISAMVLPGVSGSTVLLICGVYQPVLNAVSEAIQFNISLKLILGGGVFGLGVIVGLVSSVKLLKKALISFRSQVIYFVIGLLIGSVYAIFNGPASLDTPKEVMSIVPFAYENSINIITLVIGVVILVGLEMLKNFIEKKQNNG